MNNQDNENAKAVQEIAKATSKGIDALREARPFIEKVFGSLVEDAIGIVSDRLKHYRLTQFHTLQTKTNQRLSELGVEKTLPVPPSIAVPLIEAATITDDEEIQDLWAGLMTSAMDPDFKEEIRPAYISIIKDLSPLDARVLQVVNDGVNSLPDVLTDGQEFPSFDLTKFVEYFDMEHEELEISLQNLARLQCLTSVSDLDGTVRNVTCIGNYWMFSIRITPLGRALMKACGTGGEHE